MCAIDSMLILQGAVSCKVCLVRLYIRLFVISSTSDSEYSDDDSSSKAVSPLSLQRDVLVVASVFIIHELQSLYGNPGIDRHHYSFAAMNGSREIALCRLKLRRSDWPFS